MVIDRDKVEQAVDAQHEKQPFSGVVLIREEGNTIFEYAYGNANRSESIHNTMRTRFAIASGSKIFTAVAIAQLVEKDVITFDTLLKDCLDIKFPHFDPDITVRHLLTHSSGIPDYFDEEGGADYEELWQNRPMYTMREPKDFLPMFKNEKMKFPPGEKFSYNGAGFIVLGLIVEHHSGMSFIDYVEKNVLVRADMTDSGYFAFDRLPDRTAYSYIENESDGSWRSNIFAVPVIGAPDGGAYTTAPDMANFWSALFDYRLVSREITEELLRPQIAAKSEGKNRRYGLGVWITMKNEKTSSYYVTGWDPGVAMISEVFPDRGLLITVIGNSNKPTFPMYHALCQLLETS
jgi:CubicO group peptidase (beta-lactamase class C family)